MNEAIVIGSGVIGLTSAIRLAEAGVNTRIIAKTLPAPAPRGFTEVCSNAAAAIWYVYKAYPEHLTSRWADATYAELVSVYSQDCGVAPVLTRMVSNAEIPKPEWFERVGYQVVQDERYPFALEIELPLIEPPKYLPYLTERFKALGGTIELGTVDSVDELVAENRVIVNATGLGARELTHDPKLKPIRGQVTVVKQLNPPLNAGLMCDDADTHPMYILPRSQDIIIGGSADEGDSSTDVWEELKSYTLKTAFAHMPTLRDATHLRDVVGHRPGRDMVRLEREELTENCAVIHNYGHGGAGFTLAWGCADAVVELAKQV